MATNTTNYSLTKPAYTDTADIADINGNMDTVDSALTKLCNDLAIVEFGNNSTHSISNGSFVVWNGDLYVANQNISNGAALSGKLTAVANGGLNILNNLYETLNSKIEPEAITSSLPFRTGRFYAGSAITIAGVEIPSYTMYDIIVYANSTASGIAIRTTNGNIWRLHGVGGAWTGVIPMT